jgi:hypothetical protein
MGPEKLQWGTCVVDTTLFWQTGMPAVLLARENSALLLNWEGVGHENF